MAREIRRTDNQPAPDAEDELTLDFAQRAATKGLAVLDIGRSAGKKVALDTTHGTLSAFGFVSGLGLGAILAYSAGYLAAGFSAVIGAAIGSLAGSIIYRLTIGRAAEKRRLERQIVLEDIEALDNLLRVTRDAEQRKRILERRTQLVLKIGDGAVVHPPPSLTLSGLDENRLALVSPAQDEIGAQIERPHPQTLTGDSITEKDRIAR